MNLEEILAALRQLDVMVREQGPRVNNLVSALGALQLHVESLLRDELSELEMRVTIRVHETAKKYTELTRQYDQFAASLERLTNNEVKVSDDISEVVHKKLDQLYLDAIAGIFGIENTWNLKLQEFDKKTETYLAQKLELVREQLAKNLRWTDAEVRVAFQNIRFVDRLGNVLQAELSESGEVLFKKVAKATVGEGGDLQRAFEKEGMDSPDFGPAARALLGPRGKLAETMTDVAMGANLKGAEEGLEAKVEQSVKSALDEAGEKAAAHAGKALASKIGEGATALGSIFTAVPQMYSSVQELGEAWDKPLQSTADYMNLFSKLGGVLNQGVQTIQALAGVTKIAAAAQAVFNAVMALNPIVLIVIAVIALIALIAALIVYWDQVKATVRDNPWVAAIGVIFGPLGILISLIVLVISYWDELKLAVLRAANFISIKVQQIGAVFVGLKNLIGMVWDWIMGSVYNLGVGILNTFIEFGANFVNFFINIINGLIGMYNSVAQYIPGVDEIEEVKKINVESIKIAKKELPTIDVGAAFAGVGQVSGGLEGQIAKQEEVLRQAKAADEERRRKAQEGAAPAAPSGVPGLPAGLPAAGLAAPAVPLAGAAAVAADHSVHVEGGIHITITAERLEADSAKLLTDDMVRRLQERLDALRTERERRLGTRALAPA
jgi:hypothetical protein